MAVSKRSADTILNLLLLCGIAMIMGLSLYFWFRKISWEHVSVYAYVVYVGAPVATVLLLIWTLFLNRTPKATIVLTLGSTAFAIYAIEAVLLVLPDSSNVPQGAQGQHQANIRAAEEQGKPFDTRSKLQVVRELSHHRHDVVPYFRARSFTYHSANYPGLVDRLTIGSAQVIPLSSISRSLVVLCNESGSWVTYESDEYGFNNPRGLYAEDIEIAAVGDSFLEGLCVPRESNSISHIRKVYPNTLNLGRSGYGPLFELAVFREYVEPMRPKVVLWYYYEANDLTDLKMEISTAISRYLDPEYSQNLMEFQAEIDVRLSNYVKEQMAGAARNPPEPGIQRIPTSRALLRFLTLNGLRQKLGIRMDQFDDTVPVLQRILSLVDESTAEWGGKLYFVYLPDFVAFKEGLTPKDREKLFSRSDVLDAVDAIGIPIIDIDAAFRDTEDPLSYFPFRLKNHYNERGYAVVGQTILRNIANKPQLITKIGELSEDGLREALSSENER